MVPRSHRYTGTTFYIILLNGTTFFIILLNCTTFSITILNGTTFSITILNGTTFSITILNGYTFSISIDIHSVYVYRFQYICHNQLLKYCPMTADATRWQMKSEYNVLTYTEYANLLS